MLSKCANPGCRNEFRYLHDGKLYLIDSKAVAFARRSLSANARYERTFAALEYVWLCSSCAVDLTIHADPEHGISVVRKRATQNPVPEASPSLPPF
jgi:hypothetical protein